MPSKNTNTAADSAGTTPDTSRLSWILAGAMCLLYFGFLGLGIYAPNALAAPMRDGSAITLAMALAMVVLISAVALTALFVWRSGAVAALVVGVASLSHVDGSTAATTAPVQPGTANSTAIFFFFMVVLITLGITYWAARRTRSKSDYYAAGGNLSAMQNGLAMAGDYLSASALLGITALIYLSGFDGVVYTLGFVVGWPILVFLIAERLRRMGHFTFADVIAHRLSPKPARVLAASGTLVVVSFYLIAQMVGAGQLIRLLFGLDYKLAVCVVGTLMMLFVAFGGMTATTWVQIVKAVLLLGGAVFIAVSALSLFGFDMTALLTKSMTVHPQGAAILSPQSLSGNPVSGLSLGLALMFGTAGLPHILMRFFTVKDGATARQSVFIATILVSVFAVVAIVLGYEAIALLGASSVYKTTGGSLIGGGNMAALHLAHLVGGNVLLGLVSALAFATILAVVAGLAMSAVSAVSHDLYANVFRKTVSTERGELRVSRIATIFIGGAAIALGIAFEKQNIAYMVGLAFGIAASTNFPVLLLAMYWRGLTTRGAILGGAVGLVSAMALTILGPSIWVKLLGNAVPVFPYDPPTIFSMPLAFAVCWIVSLLDDSPQSGRDRANFEHSAESELVATGA